MNKEGLCLRVTMTLVFNLNTQKCFQKTMDLEHGKYGHFELEHAEMFSENHGLRTKPWT